MIDSFFLPVLDRLKRCAGTVMSTLYEHRLRIAALSVTIIAISFLAEYFIFGNPLRSLPVADMGARTVQESEIASDGFTTDAEGTYVSERENASLTIRTGSRYVENFVIGLSDTPTYDFSVSYIDPKSGQEYVIAKDLNGSMIKGKFSFLTSGIFHVGMNPDSIRINATSAGVSISEIKIDNTDRFNPFRFAFLLSIGAIAVGLFVLRKTVGSHPEYAFLVIVLVSGSLFVFSEPRSYTSWDEFIHYKRADKVALKDIFTKTVNDIYATTNSVPYSYSADEQAAINEHFDHDYKKIVSKKKPGGEKVSIIGRISEIYARIAYLPSGMAILAGRTLHVPRHTVFAFAQWINLFLFSILIFCSIRILRTGKLLLAVVALLPTSVFLASNFSYDSWVTGFIALGLAILFRALQDPTRTLSARETGLMIGSLVLGCAPKAIYFPLMLPLLLLKRSSFGSAKRYRYFVIAAVVSTLFVIASFALPFLVSGSDFSDGRGGKAVDAIGQVHFILSDPIGYAGILLGFLKDYLNPINFAGLATSFAYMGGMSGFLPLLAILILLTATDRNATDSATGNRIRWTIVTIVLATIILISTSLYVSFTPVGSPIINGVQPRYLIPLLFPLLFVFGHSKFGIPDRYRNTYATIVFSLISIILLHGIWSLVVSLHY
jgi:uncharacterized membrane protein